MKVLTSMRLDERVLQQMDFLIERGYALNRTHLIEKSLTVFQKMVEMQLINEQRQKFVIKEKETESTLSLAQFL